TAMGKYPFEAVKTMKRVILYSEQHGPMRVLADHDRERTMQTAIATSVMHMADKIDTKAIVAETRSGVTAIQIASMRPEVPIVAVTDELRTAQQLALAYGVKSYVRPAGPDAATKLTDWLLENHVFEKGDVVLAVSGRFPGVSGGTDTIKIRVLE
ncbi:MAG TPA: pyruvate kinase alpha/beta domain-containing protein, partial [Candidatus Saccharimonadales bacterium]